MDEELVKFDRESQSSRCLAPHPQDFALAKKLAGSSASMAAAKLRERRIAKAEKLQELRKRLEAL